ncbi:MAG: OsmC family protein [Bdellovibrionales bacterium]|nr:OsmC family protein [Bdellovibrionales bacterium]
MIQFPQNYQVSSSAGPGIQHTWTSRAVSVSSLAPFTCAIPPEFQGPGGGLSPEDLYAGALVNCFVATFKVFAEKSQLTFGELQASGTLTVDRDEKGAPWMSKFHLQVKLNGVADTDRARRLLEKTSTSCLVLNSVRTEKTFEFLVS